MSGPLPLTVKQEKLWRFIKSCERSPTYDEMARGMGLSSRGQINNTVVALKEKGFVDYIPNRARSIVALDPSARVSLITTADLAAELARRGFGFVMLPLRGRIS